MHWLPRTFRMPVSGSLTTARPTLAWRSLRPGVRVSTLCRSAALAGAFRPTLTAQPPRSSMMTSIGSSTRTPSRFGSAMDPSRRLATFGARDVKFPEYHRHIHSSGRAFRISDQRTCVLERKAQVSILLPGIRYDSLACRITGVGVPLERYNSVSRPNFGVAPCCHDIRGVGPACPDTGGHYDRICCRRHRYTDDSIACDRRGSDSASSHIWFGSGSRLLRT
jgi:hypothetical protein